MTFWENLIFWAVTGIFSIAATKFMLECKKQRALRDGVKAILRSDIIQLCNHYEEKGWAPFYAVENIIKVLRFCWLCASQLDDNNACTDGTCCLYGESQ